MATETRSVPNLSLVSVAFLWATKNGPSELLNVDEHEQASFFFFFEERDSVEDVEIALCRLVTTVAGPSKRLWNLKISCQNADYGCKKKTHVLKVHVHCHGCVQKVKKLLRRIEGVYEVTIDSEEHKVTVSGNVDCATLIRKLAKSGKQAKLWSSSPSQDRELTNWPYDDKYLNQMQNPMASLDYSKCQPLLSPPLDTETDRPDFQEYQNQGLGMEFLKCEKENSLGMEAKMDDEILGWDGSIVNDAGTAEGGMNSLMSLRGHNPGFVGLEV
ncbi:Uncharacterized protein Adt_25034 [Abeliophyllum distichum]|uniref:HMA domain-containing protein n=1 Tax=Abeliophyllum distichum TaxID=126358 RepID=A0ABD1SH13_9LAMI